MTDISQDCSEEQKKQEQQPQEKEQLQPKEREQQPKEKKQKSEKKKNKKQVGPKELKVKKLIRYQLQLISLPLILAYYELLMMIVRGNNISLLYPVLFAAGTGLVLSGLITFLPKKVYLWVKGTVIGVLAVIYIMECLLKSSFQQYMPFNVIINGAGGVTTHYSGQLFAAILHGLPLIILYLLPLGLFMACYKRWRLKTYHAMVAKLISIASGVLILLITWLAAVVGPSGAIYKESYTFHNAVQRFGLLTGIRLDAEYSLFGNRHESGFTITETAETAVPPAAQPAENEAEPETAPEETADAPESTEDTASSQQWTASEELNVIDIDFDTMIATAGDEVVQQMHEYVRSLPGTHKNSYTGAFAGKNLILITAEALSDCAVDPNLTPTLYRMANNGVKFEKFYQPSWGGSTSTGEFSFLTGIIPRDGEETILETQNHNLYYTLGNALQRQKYFSRAYHNGDYKYYSRDLTHQNLGYSEFIASMQNLESITGYSYPPDTVTFDKTLDTYIGNSPFSVYYMSLSGHSNYVPNALVDEYLDTVNQFYGDRYLDTTKYYLCYQMELDRALNMMIAKLEEAGIADDTVIALCPDHYPYGLENSATFGNDQDYLADLYGYVYTNWLELDHSVGIIWSKCMEKDPSEEGYVAPAVISGVSYSIDMVPTLLNLFGIEYDSRLLPGRDVLDPTSEGFVVWENHSWLTDYIYHDSSSGDNILADGSGQIAGPEWDVYIEQKTAEANNKILYSGRVVDRNYFGILFGEDTDF